MDGGITGEYSSFRPLRPQPLALHVRSLDTQGMTTSIWSILSLQSYFSRCPCFQSLNGLLLDYQSFHGSLSTIQAIHLSTSGSVFTTDSPVLHLYYYHHEHFHIGLHLEKFSSQIPFPTRRTQQQYWGNVSIWRTAIMWWQLRRGWLTKPISI